MAQDDMDPIHRHAQGAPERVALWTPSRQWTYAELDAEVTATSHYLQRRGIRRETRVAVHLDRGPEMVIVLWALWRAGGVAVPLSTRLPIAEVGRQAEWVGSEVLISAKTDVREHASDALTCWGLDELAIEGRNRSEAPGERGLSADRPATIIFTSGSTGSPKAVLHTWRNHLYSAKGSNANLPLRPGDRWLLSLPLYHVGGLAVLVRCAVAGATVAVPDKTAMHADALANTGATHVSLVATQLRRLLDATDGPPPTSLQAVLLGGGPIPEALLRRGYERGWPLLTSYGCTEMASQVTTTSPGAPFDDLRTAGRRLPHRRVQINDGQIMVAGAPLFAAYVTPQGLEDPRTGDGWYPTGDRGRFDASGRLHVLGRMDRMFVSGGENVQPEEIETALERIDGVERAVVEPVPSAEYGQRPVAFLRTTRSLASSHLRRVLRQRLPGFKVPDAFHSLPPECVGDGLKIDHEQLRSRARMLQGGEAEEG